MRLGEIDFSCPCARCDVIRIKSQLLIVFLEREVVASGSVCPSASASSFRTSSTLAWNLGLIVCCNIRLLQMFQQFDRGWRLIVAIVQISRAICSASPYLPSLMRHSG